MNGITKRHSTTGTSFGLERMTDFPGIGGSRSLNLPFNSIGFKCLSWDMEHWRYVFVGDVLFLLCFRSRLGGREEKKEGRCVCIHPLWN
jgi:hypothetical protein